MTQGTDYTIESMERFFGQYAKVVVTPTYGSTREFVGLIYPKVAGATFSTDRVNLYLSNGVIQPCWIEEISNIKLEEVSPKTVTALSKLYQTLQSENDALMKVEQERLKMEEKLRKLREKSNDLRLKAKKQAETVTSSLGFISREKMKQALEKILVSAGAMVESENLYDFNRGETFKFRHYAVSVREYNKGMVVDFYYSKDLEKWAQNNNYDFIYEEYDGTYQILSESTDDYRRLIDQHSRLLNSLKSEGLSSKEVRCSQGYDLDLGDKYWLTFQDQAQLVIEADIFTKDTLKTAQKTLKAFLKA